MTPEPIGEIMKAARKRKGWTQFEMARVVGVTRQRVRRLENGRDRFAEYSFRQFAAALDFTDVELDEIRAAILARFGLGEISNA